MKDIFDTDDMSDIPKELLPHKRRVLKYPNAPRWKDNPLAYWKWYQKNVRKTTTIRKGNENTIHTRPSLES
jgi:hypothetical protein